MGAAANQEPELQRKMVCSFNWQPSLLRGRSILSTWEGYGPRIWIVDNELDGNFRPVCVLKSKPWTHWTSHFDHILKFIHVTLNNLPTLCSLPLRKFQCLSGAPKHINLPRRHSPANLFEVFSVEREPQARLLYQAGLITSQHINRDPKRSIRGGSFHKDPKNFLIRLLKRRECSPHTFRYSSTTSSLVCFRFGHIYCLFQETMVKLHPNLPLKPSKSRTAWNHSLNKQKIPLATSFRF